MDLKIHNSKQNKVKVEAVRYGQCQETSGSNFFKTLIDPVLLL